MARKSDHRKRVQVNPGRRGVIHTRVGGNAEVG